MSQPPAYTPVHSFVSDSAILAYFPGQSLDIEFNGVKQTTDAIRANLKLIQRDDGPLKNGVVTFDSLAPSLQTNGISAATAWATNTQYVVGSPVVFSGSLYHGLIPHTSGVFATDLAAGKWVFVATINTFPTFTPEMFGAIPDTLFTPAGLLTPAASLRDNTKAMNDCVNALTAIGGGTMRLSTGVYKTTTGVLLNSRSISIDGSGEQASWIVHVPSISGSAVMLGTGATQLYFNRISNLSIGSPDTVITKNGVNITDVSRFTMENVTICHYPQDGTPLRGGGFSAGVRINGRDTSSVHNVTSQAEIPLVIDINPNSTITLDSWTFDNCDWVGHLDGATSNPCVLITGAAQNLTNNKFRLQNLQGGTDGFQWITTVPITSSGLSFSGIKSEQNFDAVAGVFGYTFNIQSTHRIDAFTVCESIMGDRNGFKLRGIVNPSISTVTFNPIKALEAYNVDATAGTFETKNCTFLTDLFPISTVTSGLNLVHWASTPPGLGLSTTIPPSAFYSTDLSDNFSDVKSTTFNNVGISSNGATASLHLVGGTTVTFQGTDTYVSRTSTDTLTNKTINGSSNTLNVRIGSDVSGLGTGLQTALAVNVGTAGSPVLNGGVLGIPASGTATNITGLPISTGLIGAGTGVLTALAANIGSAGAPVLFNGAGGTPSGLILTNATALPVAALVGTLLAAQEPAHTGDVTNTAGSLATVLATVNANVGTFGTATQVAQVTVNGKGLATAAANVTITPAIGSVMGIGTGLPTPLTQPINANGGVATVITQTPTIVDSSGASLALTVVQEGYQVGNMIYQLLAVTWPVTGSGATAQLNGLAVTIPNRASAAQCHIASNNSGSVFQARGVINTKNIVFFSSGGAALTNANLSNITLNIQCIYPAA